MTKMAVITKRDRGRELQWLAAWGAAQAAKKNEGDLALQRRPRYVGVDVGVRHEHSLHVR
jgi:hypothetical protein